MFKITGDFRQGVYNHGQLNGFQAMIMQREMDIDNVISDCEQAISAGLNVYMMLDAILIKNGVSNLTAKENERISKRITEIYRSKESHNEFV